MTNENRIAAALAALRESVPHTPRCISVTIGIDDIGVRLGRLMGESLTVCTCDREARVAKVQAEAVEAAWGWAVANTDADTDAGYDDFVAALEVRVGAPQKETEPNG